MHLRRAGHGLALCPAQGYTHFTAGSAEGEAQHRPRETLLGALLTARRVGQPFKAIPDSHGASADLGCNREGFASLCSLRSSAKITRAEFSSEEKRQFESKREVWRAGKMEQSPSTRLQSGTFSHCLSVTWIRMQSQAGLEPGQPQSGRDQTQSSCLVHAAAASEGRINPIFVKGEKGSVWGDAAGEATETPQEKGTWGLC